MTFLLPNLTAAESLTRLDQESIERGIAGELEAGGLESIRDARLSIRHWHDRGPYAIEFVRTLRPEMCVREREGLIGSLSQQLLCFSSAIRSYATG